MWSQLSEFLFGQFSVLGFQLEPWMLLIALPIAIVAVYFLERGWK
jgi:hypothetical protein